MKFDDVIKEWSAKGLYNRLGGGNKSAGKNKETNAGSAKPTRMGASGQGAHTKLSKDIFIKDFYTTICLKFFKNYKNYHFNQKHITLIKNLF